MASKKTITVDLGGERADIFLEKQLNVTRSRVKKLMENGNILINGKPQKAGYTLKVNDVVFCEIPEPEKLEAAPQDIMLDVVYEDGDLAVINKPQGMCVHPAFGNTKGTLVNACLSRFKDLSGINGVLRPGIVHRLDKMTSGLILIAKNDLAHLSLSEQIQTKSCKRYYMALLNGNLKEDIVEVCTQIGRSKSNRKKMAVLSEGGKTANTIFRVKQRFGGKYTLVECELKTGRTHQIRVHSKHLGHSVVGDKEYGENHNEFHLDGQLLCAYKIEFTQPRTKQPLCFETELPEYFLQVLSKCSKKFDA